jgi:hypothetical protein
MVGSMLGCGIIKGCRALGFDTVPFVVGQDVPPIGYSSHLGVE